jgi:hypothetical protein
MLIQLKQAFTFTAHYQDPNDSRIYGDLFDAELWVFDTITRTVIYTPYPDGGHWDWYQGEGGGSNTPPPDFSLSTDFEFHVYVSGATRIGYFHDGSGGFTTVITTLELTHLVTGSTCFAGNNGVIDLQVSGMAGPFEYLWDDGPTTQDRGPVPAGTYRVSVRDVPSGAVAHALITVGQNPELTVIINKAGGDVTLQVSGGIGLYTYLWSDGITTRDRVGLVDGVYFCTITDALGCSKTVQVQVQTNQYFWSRNPIYLPLDAGAVYRLDPTTKPNLSFLCEVWIEPEYLSGTFVQVGTSQEQPADANGRTVFEVQALLDVYLKHHVPAPNATGVERADPMFRRFYLKYAEQFGSTPVPAGTITLAQSYVLLGGLNFYELRARTWTNSYQDEVMPFLTWEPPVKPALVDQPEFLYYMVRTELAGFCLRIRVQFADGTHLVTTYAMQGAVLQHEVYCLAVGYQALDLAALADAAGVGIVWWEAWVAAPDQTTVLSEVRRYELDERSFPSRRFFLFATSLGGMATFAATGEPVLDVEVKGDELALTLTHDYDPALGDTAVQQRDLRPVLKVASGQRTRVQQLAAQDLLLSRRVLLLGADRWLPGFIKTKTSNLVDPAKPVPTLEFEFWMTREQLFTPRLGAGQVSTSSYLKP